MVTTVQCEFCRKPKSAKDYDCAEMCISDTCKVCLRILNELRKLISFKNQRKISKTVFYQKREMLFNKVGKPLPIIQLETDDSEDE
jgi:hypothetical protein